MKLLVDGVPLSLPDGQGGVDSIDLGSISRIEVLRGPASTLFGNAAGGVIALASQLDADAPYTQARYALGEHGYRRGELKTLGGGTQAKYALSVSRSDSQGYRQNARSESSALNARARYAWNEALDLSLSVNYTDQPIAQDAGGLTAAQSAADPRTARDRNLQFQAGEALDQLRLGLLMRQRLEPGLLQLRSFFTDRDFANRLPFESGGQVDLARRFYGAGLSFEFTQLPPGLALSIGLEGQRQDDERQRFDNLDGLRGERVFDQIETVDALGASVHVQLEPAGGWLLEAGLRFDEVHYDVDDGFAQDGDDSGSLGFRQWSPSLGVSRALPQGRLFASYSTSFEAPTTTELANPDGGGGFNAGLESQVSRSVELGYRYGSGGFSAQCSLFTIRLDDELVPFELEASPGRTFFANAGASSRNGVESRLRYRLDSDWSLSGSYTWSDFAFDRFLDADGQDFSGRQQPGIPRHFAHLALNYSAANGLSAAFEIEHSGSRFADNANQVKVAAHTVSHFRLAYDMTRQDWSWQPYLGVRNLFNERHTDNLRINAFGGRFFEPAPERSAYLGLNLRL